MAEIQPPKFVQDIRQFPCPNCGNQLQLINKKTRYVGCNYCGIVSDPNSEASKIILKLNSPSKYPPFSFLKLGMKAYINGFKYQVIGRTRWQTTHMEYWKEEIYSGYGTEKWVYDEWLLMGERFDYFYIVEDADGFYISKNIIPKYPNLPIFSPNLIYGIDPHPVKNQRLNEIGSAKVLFFEGESTYQIKPGDTIHYASYEKNKISYVIEWRTDEDNPHNQYEIKEIEFFEEKKCPIHILKKWFSNDHEASTNIFFLYERYQWTKILLGWTSVICLILSIINYHPYILKQEIKIHAEQIAQKQESKKIWETFIFDSVYVKEKNGKKTFALTDDMLNKNSEYSELKDPNLEFASISKDTSGLREYFLTYTTYKIQLPKFPIKLHENTKYYFDFDSEKVQIWIINHQNMVLDTLQSHGWKRWKVPLDGWVVVKPIFKDNQQMDINIQLNIQREYYSSLGMFISSFIFASLWILYLPISDWIFQFKTEKK